jgi:hypothetical protein
MNMIKIIYLTAFISLSTAAIATDCQHDCQFEADAIVEGCTNAKNFCLRDIEKADFCYDLFFMCTQKAYDVLENCQNVCQ